MREFPENATPEEEKAWLDEVRDIAWPGLCSNCPVLIRREETPETAKLRTRLALKMGLDAGATLEEMEAWIALGKSARESLSLGPERCG